MAITFTGKIGVKTNNASRLKKELTNLRDSSKGRVLWDAINYMAHDLPKLADFDFMNKFRDTVVVTQHIRGHKPGFANINQVLKWLEARGKLTPDDKERIFGNAARDMSVTNPGIVYMTQNIFFGRNEISENEWIYKEEIFAGKHFTKYSPHFSDNDLFSRAVDIRTTGGGKPMYNKSQSAAICQAIVKKFGSSVQCIDHTVSGHHIHLGMNTTASDRARMQEIVNRDAGYSGSKASVPDGPIGQKSMISVPIDFSSLSDTFGAPTYKDLINTDAIESNMRRSDDAKNAVQEVLPIAAPLPAELQSNGMMDVLRIGDLDFYICPVTQIGFQQTSQFMRFETLRTNGDPKIATDTAPSNVTVNLIFPNRQAINTDLRSLIAQFIKTPVTIVQSRFIARTMKAYQNDHQDKGTESGQRDKDGNIIYSPEEEAMWMVMTDLSLHSVPGFPELFEASVTMEYFEDRIFGDRLRLLESEKDLAVKYDKKLVINGHNITPPSEKLRISRSERYKARNTIRVTMDPKRSSLYQTYYKTMLKAGGELLPYNQPEDDRLTVSFNDMDITRSSLKEAERVLGRRYDDALNAVAKLLDAGGTQLTDYLNARLGIQAITSSDLKNIGNGLALGTSAMIDFVFKQSGLNQGLQKLGSAANPLTARIAEYIREGKASLQPVISELGFGEQELTLAGKLIDFGARTAGTFRIPEAGLDIFDPTARQKLTNVDDVAKFIGGTGLIAEIEVLMGDTLFGKVPVKDQVIQVQGPEVRAKLDKIRKAIVSLTDAVMGSYTQDVKSNETQKELNSVLSLYSGLVGRQDRNLELYNKTDRIMTGVSFQMNNKIVPMPVSGWKKTSFQHMGRSDWFINMNLTVKGDKAIHELMYAMNKVADFSKKFQTSVPMKLTNLDTTFFIQNTHGIFKTLGIKKMLLSTAQISTVPNNPDLYTVNLGFEQADLNIKRDLERVSSSGFKGATKSAKELFLNKILPVLKAVNTNRNSSNYGMVLDHEKIKRVMDDRRLFYLWEFLNVENFDYMDKYNIIKATIATGVDDGILELEGFRDKLFPKAGPDQDSRLLLTSRLLSFRDNILSYFRTQLNTAQHPNGVDIERAIYDTVTSITDLIEDEVSGKLYIQQSKKIDHPGIIEALNEYHTNIMILVNGYMKFAQGVLQDTLDATGLGVQIAAALVGIVGVAITGGILLPVLIGAASITTMFVTTGALVHLSPYVESIQRIALSFAGGAVANKLIDVARDLMIDETLVRSFPTDLKIGTDANGDILTLQDTIDNAKKEIQKNIGGCYTDFNFTDLETDIPAHIMDPGFYMYTNDMVTNDLIDELLEDIDNKANLLRSKLVTQCIQYDGLKKEIVGRSGKLPYQGSDVERDPEDKTFISVQDIKWADSVVTKIKDLTKATVIRPDRDTSQKQKSLYSNEILDDEFYGAAAEEGFLRLNMITQALKWDALKSAWLNAIRDKVTAPSSGDRGGNQTTEFKNFMKNWFPKIMEAGGVDAPAFNGESVNDLFAKEHKNKQKKGQSMYQYYKDYHGMLEVVHKVQNLAKVYSAYKQSQNAQAGKKMAEYANLSSDPRMIEKRAVHIKTLMDLMRKAVVEDQTSDPARIFPTYKVYFIEEDIPEWGIFHDFYDYSAIQDITVVKDRKSASDVCSIKMSNISGKLTDSFAEHVPEYGTENAIPLSSVMLKPGTSILVKMGYSNNQVELPVVFYGIITEVNVGPVVEVLCQGYGAELNEVIAREDGVKHGARGDVKALGDVVTWILQHTYGLNHFGKLGFIDLGKTDNLRESGTLLSGNQAKMKLASFLTGIPGLRTNDPRDDNIFMPYNTSNIIETQVDGIGSLVSAKVAEEKGLWSNATFDWYIRDVSAWDAIKEVTYFHPDTIMTVLPYNNNIFPFLPRIRNTLYVGPRKGYYKYTDYFAISGRLDNREVVTEKIEKFKRDSVQLNDPNLPQSLLRAFNTDVYPPPGGHVPDMPYGTLSPEVVATLKGVVSRISEDPDVVRLLGALLGVDINSVINSLQLPGRGFGVYLELFDAYRKIYVDDQGNVIRDITEDIKRLVSNDVGLTSLDLNRTGESHQYRKVQEHHILTSHTNILSNNIAASAQGWANQIRLLTFEDPTIYTSKDEVAIKDRDKFVTEVFNIDDDIYDDHIRTKEVFMNNIDPNLWDDVAYAKYAIKQSSAYYSMSPDGATDDDGVKPEFVSQLKNKDNRKRVENLKQKASQPQNLWRFLPSRWRVGVSLLAEEARDMYDGELTIVGNSKIKPYDVLHIIDYVNDMHGAVEAGRVIHSMSAQTGFITRIKPDLIVNQKDKFNEQEIFYMSQMSSLSTKRTAWGFGGSFVGALSTGGAASTVLQAVGGLAKASAATISTLAMAGWFVGAGAFIFLGYKALKYHNERILLSMSNIVGRDSLDLLPLTYKGLQYVAGIEGYRKDNPIRHMFSSILTQDGRMNVIERFGYANRPMEMAFYKDILGNSPAWASFKTMFSFGDSLGPIAGPLAGANALTSAVF